MYIGLIMSGRLKYITAELLVSQLSNFEVERAIEKLRKH
jgi:hypothetical protein